MQITSRLTGLQMYGVHFYSPKCQSIKTDFFNLAQTLRKTPPQLRPQDDSSYLPLIDALAGPKLLCPFGPCDHDDPAVAFPLPDSSSAASSEGASDEVAAAWWAGGGGELCGPDTLHCVLQVRQVCHFCCCQCVRVTGLFTAQHAHPIWSRGTACNAPSRRWAAFRRVGHLLLLLFVPIVD